MFDSKKFLSDVSHEPGVYRMYDDKDQVIYVGKAKDLKKRLSSYFRKNLSSKKQKPWCRQFIISTQPLRLLKQKRYCLSITLLNFISLVITYYCEMINPILYFIDKRASSSYYFLSRNEKIAGEYFGPYPHAGAVRETLSLMQKLFPVRQCENSVYNNRSRPCLQYQIGRCSAPCVPGYVTDEEYNQQVELARLFLQGKDQQVLDYLIGKMEQASRDLDFEGQHAIVIKFRRFERLSKNNSFLMNVWMTWILCLLRISTV